jgi:hypothetical protein
MMIKGACLKIPANFQDDPASLIKEEIKEFWILRKNDVLKEIEKVRREYLELKD